MKVTQGTFSHLPSLTDEEIEAQLRYAIGNGWALSVESTDDPHPRNLYWDMWGLPIFDLVDPAPVLDAIRECRAAHPDRYVRVVAFDNHKGRETVVVSFLVQQPDDGAGFEIRRQHAPGRTNRYTLFRSTPDR